MEAPKLTPRTETVTLFQGHDLASMKDKAKDVENQVRTAPPRRLNEPDPINEIAREFDATVDEYAAAGVDVVLTALPRKKYRELKNQHPVRMVDGPVDPNDPDSLPGKIPHPVDGAWGFNWETFGDDLVPACMEADTFGGPEGVEVFLDSLADGDFSLLYSRAVDLNQGQAPDPKVRLSSLLDRTSGETSTFPERLG